MNKSRSAEEVLESCSPDVRVLADKARQLLLKLLPQAEESVDPTASVLSYGYGPGYYYGPPAPAYGYGPAYYGGPVYAGPPGGDAVAYCMQTYRSYNPRTGMFLGYDGAYHPCP